jgi:uncharacterized membrane protein
MRRRKAKKQKGKAIETELSKKEENQTRRIIDTREQHCFPRLMAG